VVVIERTFVTSFLMTVGLLEIFVLLQLIFNNKKFIATNIAKIINIEFIRCWFCLAHVQIYKM